jgi:hypothetical protein
LYLVGGEIEARIEMLVEILHYADIIVPIRGKIVRPPEIRKKSNAIETCLIYMIMVVIASFSQVKRSMSRFRMLLCIKKVADGFHPSPSHPGSIPECRRQGTNFHIRQIPKVSSIIWTALQDLMHVSVLVSLAEYPRFVAFCRINYVDYLVQERQS